MLETLNERVFMVKCPCIEINTLSTQAIQRYNFPHSFILTHTPHIPHIPHTHIPTPHILLVCCSQLEAVSDDPLHKLLDGTGLLPE